MGMRQLNVIRSKPADGAIDTATQHGGQVVAGSKNRRFKGRHWEHAHRTVPFEGASASAAQIMPMDEPVKTCKHQGSMRASRCTIPARTCGITAAVQEGNTTAARRMPHRRTHPDHMGRAVGNEAFEEPAPRSSVGRFASTPDGTVRPQVTRARAIPECTAYTVQATAQQPAAHLLADHMLSLSRGARPVCSGPADRSNKNRLWISSTWVVSASIAGAHDISRGGKNQPQPAAAPTIAACHTPA